jgi:putative ABC transport system substrate-binding protein
MRRRNFIKVIVGSAAAWPLMAHAGQLSQVPTVGILWHAGSVEEEAIYLAQIQQGLQVLGYAEGRNKTEQQQEGYSDASCR